MYLIQPGHQRPGWVLFALVDDGATQGHSEAWKGVTDGPGQVPAKNKERLNLFPAADQSPTV